MNDPLRIPDDAGTQEEQHPTTERRPLGLVDGSKVILRLGPNDTFSFDNQCRILFATNGIELDRRQGNGSITTGHNSSPNVSTVIIDSGVIGHRFIPIRLAQFGIVYTRDTASHVTVGPFVRRQKVSGRALPYRTCNKFTVDTAFPAHCVPTLSGPYSTPLGLAEAVITTAKQTVSEIALTSLDPASALLFIKADDSVARYTLAPGESAQLHSSKLLAWTATCMFEVKDICCFRFVTGVTGPGTVWMQASKRVPARGSPW